MWVVIVQVRYATCGSAQLHQRVCSLCKVSDGGVNWNKRHKSEPDADVNWEGSEWMIEVSISNQLDPQRPRLSST